MPGLFTVADTDDLKQAEERVERELRNRAKNQIEGVNSDGEMHVRDLLPDEDLDQDDDNNVNGWNGTDREWVQSGMTGNQLNQIYEIDSSGNAEDKLIGIFAISSIATDILTTEITLEDGTGSRFERLQFQEAQTLNDGEYALMRNPVIFNEGKDANIYQYPDQDGDDKVVYHGLVAEKAGTTLGTRSQTEGSATGTARRPSRR